MLSIQSQSKLSQRICSGLLACLLLCSPVLVGAEKNPSKVRDLAYGSVLYSYFQQDYFSALSELMVADQQGSIVDDKQRSDLLRGGIYLSYGMDSEAERLFSEVIAVESDTKSKSRSENLSRAWFYLGKLRYKKGEYQQAAASFANVDKSLTRSLYPEYGFLADSARMRLVDNSAGDSSIVLAVDKKLDESRDKKPFEPKVSNDSSWSYYQDYNQLLDQLAASSAQEDSIVDQRKIADTMRAIAGRIENSEDIANVEELLALRDQIYTSAGFLYLQAESATDAMRSFKRVRQDSVLVGQALLGYGWAAANNEDYRKALAPWQQLASNSMLDPTTHEALLAVPFAYEKLGADAAALTEYDASVSALQQELQLLNGIDDYLSEMPASKLSEYYLDSSAKWLDETSLENSEEKSRFADEVLHNRLLDLLAQNHFSYLEQQRQDVQWLLQQLSRWELELDAIRYVVDQRQQRRTESISDEALAQVAARLEQLTVLREQLAEQLSVASDDLAAGQAQQLMTVEQRKIAARINHADGLFNSISTNPNVEEFIATGDQGEELQLKQKQIGWARGLLLWQVSQQSSDRYWQMAKNMRAIDAAIAEAKQQYTELQILAISRDMQQRELSAAAELQNRIGSQRETAAQMASQIDHRMLALLREDIQKLRKRTTVYLAQSSMARARLLDTLSEEGDNLPVASLDSGNGEEIQ